MEDPFLIGKKREAVFIAVLHLIVTLGSSVRNTIDKYLCEITPTH